MALASGHLASFDRRKVKGPLNGPKATGQHAREGWTFYTKPSPPMKGLTIPGGAEASYYTWVDQLNTFGLSRNVPINPGNESEGLLALKDSKFVILRVPPACRSLHPPQSLRCGQLVHRREWQREFGGRGSHCYGGRVGAGRYPLGFYTKWVDGRIDNPDAGWKGRGLWACISTRAPCHMETGKSTTSNVMKFSFGPIRWRSELRLVAFIAHRFEGLFLWTNRDTYDPIVP